MTHKYKIVTGNLPYIADIDTRKKIIYIDKSMPKKFFEGIVAHEIEERKHLSKGHTYKFSHKKGEKKELQTFKRQLGSLKKAKKFFNEEKKYTDLIAKKYISKELSQL